MDQRIIDVLEQKQQQVDRGYFTVRSNRQTSRILIEEVLYIESLADYVRIHMADGRTVQSKEKISHMEQIGSDKIQQLNALANSITQASSSLTDERTLAGLKHLEAIVVKK